MAFFDKFAFQIDNRYHIFSNSGFFRLLIIKIISWSILSHINRRFTFFYFYIFMRILKQCNLYECFLSFTIQSGGVSLKLKAISLFCISGFVKHNLITLV